VRKISLGEITVTTKASSKFASLRTTIPMSVVKQWKLNEGDKLEWEWEARNGEMILKVTKVKEQKQR
jgi:bifunctional DNA-binding transcriptional regulator/antitoxin component of YhaV-PrlF toxin-antitoxin module